ncbi:MAG TPA: hypothetical protein VFE61_01915 [Candidatus Sulfotelmatobacter sp.]|jgi:hypothetical protein|nr:hypothetical protein [Candidatus Sulfotelmatobacter sp.]
MDFQALVFLLVTIFVSMFITFIVVSRMEAKKRTQAMQAAAHAIGFDFPGDLWNRQPDAQRLGTALLDLGTRRRFKNLMVGKTAGFGTNLFDYSYTISAGEESSTHTQTVVAFSQELWPPSSKCGPKAYSVELATLSFATISTSTLTRNSPDATSCVGPMKPAYESCFRRHCSPSWNNFPLTKNGVSKDAPRP